MVEIVKRVPANIARTKNAQELKKNFLKQRDYSVESRNSSKSLAHTSLIETFANKHGICEQSDLSFGVKVSFNKNFCGSKQRLCR